MSSGTNSPPKLGESVAGDWCHAPNPSVDEALLNSRWASAKPSNDPRAAASCAGDPANDHEQSPDTEAPIKNAAGFDPPSDAGLRGEASVGPVGIRNATDCDTNNDSKEHNGDSRKRQPGAQEQHATHGEVYSPPSGGYEGKETRFGIGCVAPVGRLDVPPARRALAMNRCFLASAFDQHGPGSLFAGPAAPTPRHPPHQLVESVRTGPVPRSPPSTARRHRSVPPALLSAEAVAASPTAPERWARTMAMYRPYLDRT